jgi:membrane protease YdiL (CAAX protease family)
VLIVVVYLAFFLTVSWAVGRLFDGVVDADDELADFTSIVVGMALPIAVGGAGLLWFSARRGWSADIFGRQPVAGRAWMWLAPVLVLFPVTIHAWAADWNSWSLGQLAGLVVLGLCVGFTEELLARGVVVKILRDAGHRERFVACVSSLLFALMHTSNLVSGMSVQTVAATVVYTFGFGACMYLTMRVTRTIWAAVLLHALTDPTTILTAGAVDTSLAERAGGGTALALVATLLLVGFGIAALFAVRGEAGRAADVDAAA